MITVAKGHNIYIQLETPSIRSENGCWMLWLSVRRSNAISRCFLFLDFYFLTGNFMKNYTRRKNAVLSSISLEILKQFVSCSFNLLRNKFFFSVTSGNGSSWILEFAQNFCNFLYEKFHMLARSRLLEREIRDKPESSPSGTIKYLYKSMHICSSLSNTGRKAGCVFSDLGLFASLIVCFV